MKILTLILKKIHFDNIRSGKKRKENREVRPTTSKKYCEYDAGGNFVGPQKYDAIRFYMGYETGRPSMLVQVTGAEIFVLTDDNGNDITYKHENEDYVACEIEYSLGDVLETENC